MKQLADFSCKHIRIESSPVSPQQTLKISRLQNKHPVLTPKNVKSGVFVLFKIIQPLHNKRVAILKESDEKRLIFIYPFTLIFQTLHRPESICYCIPTSGVDYNTSFLCG